MHRRRVRTSSKKSYLLGARRFKSKCSRAVTILQSKGGGQGAEYKRSWEEVPKGDAGQSGWGVGPK